MTSGDSSTRPHARKWSAFDWLRVALSIGILTSVAVWVVRDSAFLQQLSIELVMVSTALSVLTCFLHSLVLVALVHIHGRRIAAHQALRVTALGSLGNAAGGLPIGTALKYAVLHKQVGLTLGQITRGLLIFTIGISASLLLYAVISILLLNLGSWIKLTAIGTLSAGATLGAVVVWKYRHHRRLRQIVGPFIQPSNLLHVAWISFLAATSLVLNSCVIGTFLLPGYSIVDLIFISASGILLGILSLLQSVAGIQEIAMAIMASLAQGHPADGAQIALTIRATAVLASVLVLALQFLIKPSRKP